MYVCLYVCMCHIYHIIWCSVLMAVCYLHSVVQEVLRTNLMNLHPSGDQRCVDMCMHVCALQV